MATETPSQRRLSIALRSLKTLQDQGISIIKTDELSRPDRETLLNTGFLKPIIKGWYMPSRPDEGDGNTTSWYANAENFISRYCENRFGNAWCVSADHSIRMHTGSSILPAQVVISAPAGQNSVTSLPGGHSILDYRTKELPQSKSLSTLNGIRVMTLEYALTKVSEAFFRTYAQDAHIALMGLRDSSALIRHLMESGQSVVAGRLSGALRATGKSAMADNILDAMKSIGHLVVESNPFSETLPTLNATRGESPYVTRIRLMWAAMREVVISEFPPEPGIPANLDDYMFNVKDSYVRDAYNSLSIEGYKVTEELIERVASGSWNPELNEVDTMSRDAMAARGYFQARKVVEQSILNVLSGANAGAVTARDHRTWYRELFSPSVDAKILSAADLAGYRGHQVFIKNAKHVPPPKEAIPDMMPALFDLLETEKEASVRAVLGHFVFVFTHPYMDGNGRMGRFLMNTMLASGGYPWTVIEVSRRGEYMAALNEASSNGNIKPFAQFIASSLEHETELLRDHERSKERPQN